MNFLNRQINNLDNFQRRHKFFGFAIAVLKKYGEDRSSHSNALITYYGFLSLFPLLLVLTSVLQLLVGNGLHANLLNTINSYFPVLGNDIGRNIHGLTTHRNSIIGLVIGLLGSFLGARGIADILRNTINNIWHVPPKDQLGFPKNLINSLSIIIVGGIGVVLTIVTTGYTTGIDHSLGVRILGALMSFVILSAVLYIVFGLALSIKVPGNALLTSALITATGILLLETVGGYLVSHELKHFSTVYGTFAIVLGLLFWIYLQTQIMLYALQIAVVKQRRLWPRALNSNNPTAGDHARTKLAEY